MANGKTAVEDQLAALTAGVAGLADVVQKLLLNQHLSGTILDAVRDGGYEMGFEAGRASAARTQRSRHAGPRGQRGELRLVGES